MILKGTIRLKNALKATTSGALNRGKYRLTRNIKDEVVRDDIIIPKIIKFRSLYSKKI